MSKYLGSTTRIQDYFIKEWSRANITPAECAGIWIKVISTIFCNPNDHPFQIKPQFEVQRYYHTTASPSPVWVLFDDEATIAVIEVRSPKEFMDWSSIQGQAYRYIQNLDKRSHPTIGIIAQGDKFLCWEQMPVGGDVGFRCTVPRRLFPQRGSPASVVWDSDAVETYFEGLRTRAKDGEFIDH